jgi:hypothetical protein
MNLQEHANQVRETPLCELLQWRGFEIKSEGVTFRAKNDRHNIVVTGNRWFDNKAAVGGLGAIDLQMHLTGEDFAAAYQTLATDFRAVSTAEIGLSFPIHHCIRPNQARRPFDELAARYAVPNEANWPIARAYLVGRRSDFARHTAAILISSQPWKQAHCLVHARPSRQSGNRYRGRISH